MGPDPSPLNERDSGSGSGSGSGPGPLADLAAGLWSRWPGLSPSTTLADADAQLGPTPDTVPHSGMFVGPTMFRLWDARAGAPRGLTVWFEGVTVVGVDVRGARRAPADAALPEPDAVLRSGYGDDHQQLVWGARGLVIHRRSDDEDSAELLLGLRPFDPAGWETHPLRWWGSTRSPW